MATTRAALPASSIKYKPVRKPQTLLIYLALIGLGAFFTFPFLWTVLSALKSPREIFVFPPPIFPEKFMWSNFVEVVRQVPFFRFGLNTLTVALLSVVGDITTATLVAYGFTRFRFPGRDALFLLVISTLLLPPEVTIIPQFLMFRMINLIDSLVPLILPAFLATSGFSIFLMRQFLLTLPKDLDEAATMDGAGSMRILWQILVPLSKPAIATVGIFSFLYHWNDFFRPLVFLSTPENFTLAIGLRYFQRAVQTGGEPKEQLLMAAVVMMTIPVTILFFAMQHYFVEGIAMSGIRR
ncbi:MAG: carbohydrate ABC transporter permease [Caldilineaceae bacterium]